MGAIPIPTTTDGARELKVCNNSQDIDTSGNNIRRDSFVLEVPISFPTSFLIQWDIAKVRCLSEDKT